MHVWCNTMSWVCKRGTLVVHYHQSTKIAIWYGQLIFYGYIVMNGLVPTCEWQSCSLRLVECMLMHYLLCTLHHWYKWTSVTSAWGMLTSWHGYRFTKSKRTWSFWYELSQSIVGLPSIDEIFRWTFLLAGDRLLELEVQVSCRFKSFLEHYLQYIAFILYSPCLHYFLIGTSMFLSGKKNYMIIWGHL